MELTPLPASFTVAPWRLSGVVYGALMNHTAQLAALGDAVHAAPYKAPPAHAVLQVRPRNTLCGPGSAVTLPWTGCWTSPRTARTRPKA